MYSMQNFDHRRSLLPAAVQKSSIIGRLFITLLLILLLEFSSDVVLAEGLENLPPFVQHKIESSFVSQPLLQLASDPIPLVAHYFNAKLQSRNDRYFGRSDEAYEAQILIDEKGVRGHLFNTKKEIDYHYDNGRLLMNDIDCITDPKIVAPLINFKDFVSQLEEILHGEGKEIQTYDEGLNRECSGMKMYGIIYADTPFVLCATSTELKHAVSENVWIEILEWSVDRTRIEEIESQPLIKPELFDKCMPPVMTTEFETLKPISSLSVPWFFESTVCRLPFIRDTKYCKDSNPIEATADCVFLHGVGETDTGEYTETHHDYWGHIEDYTPQCKTRLFIHQETKKRGWNNEELQLAYCEAALHGNAENDKMIRNKVLFVHSMGNLVLGAAINNNLCHIDKNSTSWYNIMGPLMGSKAADKLDVICDKTSSDSNALFRYIAEKGGYCNTTGNGEPYPAYKTLQTGAIDEKIKQTVNDNTKGSICGDSPIGIISKYSVLKLLSIVVSYNDDNDGMVTTPSCQKEDTHYNPDYTSALYLATINHADGTCRSGNSWIFGKSKSPCSFYTGKV